MGFDQTKNLFPMQKCVYTVFQALTGLDIVLFMVRIQVGEFGSLRLCNNKRVYVN